jgi:fatty-acyl-CoA synthase
LLVGKLNPLVVFDGYVDSKATDAKILVDLFQKGDRYFNTGDLLQLHPYRWLSFVDRMGDTFRWKGENVSTNEVAEILNHAGSILESNVYGVTIPNTEGRAGMAAIRTDSDFQLSTFTKHVLQALANYQRPLFLRILTGEMKITSTFKHQKGDYRKEGYSPKEVSDPLYVLIKNEYHPLTIERFEAIERGDLVPG